MTIRIATASDESKSIDTLTLAFCTDPMVRWSLPDPAKYLTVFPSLARAFGGSAFGRGTAYVADDFAGSALWLPPGIESDEKSLISLLEENSPHDIKDDMPKIFEEMQQYHPTEPHWYLPLIGVDPVYQGTGVGSALMTEALKAVDRDGLTAYLESSNPRNIPLYERHGFEVLGEIQSGSSPVLRPMLRRAQ